MNNLSPETREAVRAQIKAQIEPIQKQFAYGHIHSGELINAVIDAAADRIASLLTSAVEGNTIENARKFCKSEDIKTLGLARSMVAYAQSLRPGGGWISVETLPDNGRIVIGLTDSNRMLFTWFDQSLGCLDDNEINDNEKFTHWTERPAPPDAARIKTGLREG